MTERLFRMWHMHLGPKDDPRAMSEFYIPCSSLWFWEVSIAEARRALEPKP